jgi:hypothetical protein
MTPKQIMALAPAARLEVEARARVGDVEAVRDWVRVSAWLAISRRRDLRPRQKVAVFTSICKHVDIVVEGHRG